MERELKIEKDQVSDWVGDLERAQRKRLRRERLRTSV